MGLYDLISLCLTFIGYTLLVFRSVSYLHEKKSNQKLQSKLCKNFVAFVIFIKIQYLAYQVAQIIPLGTILLLTIKFYILLPENSLSNKVYKTIEKQLEKIKLDEYNSSVGKYTSFVCKHIVNLLMKIIQQISPYINNKDIQQTQTYILEIIKSLEYKKAAVHLRHQAGISHINNDLDMSQLNQSSTDQMENRMNDFQPIAQPNNYRKSNIGNQMSKILDFDQDNQYIKIKAELLVIKPNRQKNIKAKYEDVNIDFYSPTSEIIITNSNNAVQTGILKQIKWVTKNMINLELILQKRDSKIIRMKDKADVAKWAEPVCMALKKYHK